MKWVFEHLLNLSVENIVQCKEIVEQFIGIFNSTWINALLLTLVHLVLAHAVQVKVKGDLLRVADVPGIYYLFLEKWQQH